MRLIDADALMENAYDSGTWKDVQTGFHQRVVDVEDIENAPTVDAELVRHGRWIGISDGYADGFPVYDEWECSSCGRIIEADEEPTLKYCPQCGAKMYGERREE